MQSAKRTRRPDSGSAGALVPARRHAVAEPGAEQGHRIQRSRARRARPEGAAAAARVQPGGTGQPRPRQLSSPRQPAREIHLPDLAARSQRSALLSHPHGEPRRDAAHRLHADGGTRLREVRPHLPAAARDLRHGRGPRPGEGAPSQLAASGRGDDRRHRRRAHPRPRRPGLQRHGDSGRQALALHRLRRHPPDAVPAGDARRGHQQPDAARRPALPRPGPAASHRRGLRRAGRGVRQRGRARSFRAWWCSSRTSPTTTPFAS